MREGENTWELGEQHWELEISGKEYWRNSRNHMKHKLKHIGEHHREHVIEPCVRVRTHGNKGNNIGS